MIDPDASSPAVAAPGGEDMPAPAALGAWRIALIGAVSLVVFALLIGLGAWQVERLRWKEGVVATIDARIHEPPRPLDEVDALRQRTGDVDYVPAEARGTFLHSGERYFLATLEGQAGWNVYTPLLLDGRPEAIFVNRGFVPYEAKDPATRPAGQVGGPVTIIGLARNPAEPQSGWFVPENDLATGTFFQRDIGAMAQNLALPAGTQLLPFFLDAGPGAAPGGIPVGGVTVIDIPNNHLQYAVTWFALAAVLAVMLTVFAVHHWRLRRPRA